MPTVQTPKDHSTVPVIPDILEMESRVLVRGGSVPLPWGIIKGILGYNLFKPPSVKALITTLLYFTSYNIIFWHWSLYLYYRYCRMWWQNASSSSQQLLCSQLSRRSRYQPVALDKMLLCQVPKRMIQMIAGYPLISCASTYETSPKTMMIHHWTPYWSINVDILQFLSLCKSITATPPKKSEA